MAECLNDDICRARSNKLFFVCVIVRLIQSVPVDAVGSLSSVLCKIFSHVPSLTWTGIITTQSSPYSGRQVSKCGALHALKVHDNLPSRSAPWEESASVDR